MRLLIYLLAMLTGFSAAEAARPVSAVPSSVDAAVGQTYARVAVKVAEKAQTAPEITRYFTVALVSNEPPAAFFSALEPSTPVLRHDVIRG